MPRTEKILGEVANVLTEQGWQRVKPDKLIRAPSTIWLLSPDSQQAIEIRLFGCQAGSQAIPEGVAGQRGPGPGS